MEISLNEEIKHECLEKLVRLHSTLSSADLCHGLDLFRLRVENAMISHHRHHRRLTAQAATTPSVQSIDLLVQWNTYLTFELIPFAEKERSMFVH